MIKNIDWRFKMTREEIKKAYDEGLDCAGVILSHYSNILGLSQQYAQKLGSGFGGGMGKASTCGVVTGALIVLGGIFGYGTRDVDTQKIILLKKREEFFERFEKKFPCGCKEILGYDFTTKEGMDKILEKNLLNTVCFDAISYAVDILDDLIKEEENIKCDMETGDCEYTEESN